MLGKAVVREARGRGWSVLGPSRGQADVTDAGRVRDAVASFRPELVVNCAALTRVDDCETRREEAFAVNAAGAGHVADAATAAGAALVQVSTDYVFDGRERRPYREDAPTAPLSVYGASKLGGEEAARRHPRALVLRTSWLFGPGGSNFVATIAHRLRERAPLRVVDDQVGCPTYTRFLAAALLDLARRGATGLLHYRNREPVSWHGFALEIAGLCDRGAAVEPVASASFPRPARRPAYSVLDVERCEALLGRRVEPWGWGLAEYLHDRRRNACAR
jgi:dTDP-4-dehydrorhamnose reductase